MKTLILGTGNLLLSDEGFGVHFVRYLEQHYHFPPEIQLLDAGTAGIMVIHELEEADCVYIIDVIEAAGEPGTCQRYAKEEFLLKRLPVKLSPHQVGVQEMLMVSQLRGRCPDELFLLGIIPASLAPGSELSPRLQAQIPQLAESLITELRCRGLSIWVDGDGRQDAPKALGAR